MATRAVPLPADLVSEGVGYTAARHQREVGTGFFDPVRGVINGGNTATEAMTASTEIAHFG